jgi:hypothetical protein
MKYEDYKELGSEAAVKVCPVCTCAYLTFIEVGVVGGIIHMCSDPTHNMHYVCVYHRHAMSGADQAYIEKLSGHN